MLLGAKNFGISDAKPAEMWIRVISPSYSIKERLALNFALAAAAQPNSVTDAQFAELHRHWSDTETTEILGAIAMFAFLNRWKDTIATPLAATPETVTRIAMN